MTQVKALISYKTKVRVLTEPDGTEVEYVEFKKKVTKSDCNLKPCDHPYYNSDLFPIILKRAYDQVLCGRQWAALDDLPDSVHVDTSGFLATVTVAVLV